MNSIEHLPLAKQTLLHEIVDQLSGVDGVAAVVLGGSYAGGGYHDASDLDVGIYYYPDFPFSISAVRQVADSFSAQGSATVTDFYGWGAWVNGGAWIHTAHGKVDFLYRNIDQVQRALTDAHQGIVHLDYAQQPTHGFFSVIYLAETQICIPLYDPQGIIAGLKAEVAVYPAKLKQRTLADSLWSAEFTLLFARDYAAQGDVYNTVGCLSRAASSLTQALFALNEVYFIRDKKVTAQIAAFPLVPPGYVDALAHVLGNVGNDAPTLAASVSAFHDLWSSVVALPEVDYQPKFNL